MSERFGNGANRWAMPLHDGDAASVGLKGCRLSGTRCAPRFERPMTMKEFLSSARRAVASCVLDALGAHEVRMTAGDLMRTDDVTLADHSAALFMTDPDLIEVLDGWHRGLMKDDDFMDRLLFLRSTSKTVAEKRLEKIRAEREDDEHHAKEEVAPHPDDDQDGHTLWTGVGAS